MEAHKKKLRLSALFAPIDMTEGRPGSKIIMFAIPMLIGNIAQQLYNTVDSIVVGRYVGDNALAAVGSAGPILNLLLVLFVGISVGAGIMVSQYFGAKEKEELAGAIGCSITLTAIASVFIMVIGPFLVRPLLRLLNTPDSIIDWCASYLIILFVGIAGMAYYNILSGILRGLGDSVSALIYLLVATVLNIFLDILFVTAFDMGVAGVSLATAIAQAVSAILCLIKLTKMTDIFELRLSCLKPQKRHTVDMIRLGLPSGLTQAIFSMAMIVVQSLTNSFGEMLIAANVIIMRVDGFAMMPNFSFGTAMTTFAGQNVGAKKYDRVKQGAKEGTLIAIGVAMLITCGILLFGRYLMEIFTQTAELVALSVYMMRILAVGYIAMAVTQCLSGVMRGAGDTMTPMWISLITTVVIRVPLAYGIAWSQYQKRNASQWQKRMHFHFSAGLLGAGRSDHPDCLQTGRMEEKSAGTGRTACRQYGCVKTAYLYLYQKTGGLALVVPVSPVFFILLFILCVRIRGLRRHVVGGAHIFRTDLHAVLIGGEIGLGGKASRLFGPEFKGTSVQVVIPYQTVYNEVLSLRIGLQDDRSGIIVPKPQALRTGGNGRVQSERKIENRHAVGMPFQNCKSCILHRVVDGGGYLADPAANGGNGFPFR